MKIGEAARRTCLSENAIRVYVENGLIHPNVEQGIHRNSYDFTEENVRQLEQIALFRKAGFSIFEISIILQMPEKLPVLLESKRQSLEADISDQDIVREALERIQASEMGDPKQVADALRPAVANLGTKPTKKSNRNVPLIVVAALMAAIVVWLEFVGVYRPFHEWIRVEPFAIQFALALILLLISPIPGIMSLRYGTAVRRAQKMEGQATGTVIKITDEHGFDGSFARAGSGSAGTREPGIGGIWQIFFMLWNELRPDCWFPVIQYIGKGGKLTSGTFLYGGFKRDWKEGKP